MTYTLGADPGHNSGAAVLLEGQRLATWVAWWRSSGGKPYRVWVPWRMAEQQVDGPLSAVLARWERESLRHWTVVGAPCAVEGLYQGASHHMVYLAESAGRLCQMLEVATSTRAHRPLASEWRPRILGGSPREKAYEAEARAVQLAPLRVEGLADALERVPCTPKDWRARGALAEACCIALWARSEVRG